jgi:hypothetical protein
MSDPILYLDRNSVLNPQVQIRQQPIESIRFAGIKSRRACRPNLCR